MSNGFMAYVYLALTGITTASVGGQTLNQSIELMNEKLKGYDRRHRPIVNQSLAIQVNLTFSIIAIQDFDEVDSKFSVVGALFMAWYDSQIIWDPSAHGGITTQLYQPADVWYPVLVLGNPYDSLTDIASNSTLVRFESDGHASFTPGSVFRTTCSVDVTYYPFDTQNCDVRFVPWGYSPTEVKLHTPYSIVFLDFYTPNGEWTIGSTSAYHDSINTVWFSFTLRRKPIFLVINVLLPVMFLAFINALVFVLPSESGERISYSITVLLSIAVFLTFVGDNLPKTSEPISILSYYMMLILVLSVLICLAVILNMNLIHRKKQKSVSCWGKALVSVFCCKCGDKRKFSGDSNKVRPSDDSKLQATSTHTATEQFVKSMLANYQMPTIPSSRDQEDDAVTWREVSYAIDKLCMLSFTAANVLFATVFIGVLAGHDAQSP